MRAAATLASVASVLVIAASCSTSPAVKGTAVAPTPTTPTTRNVPTTILAKTVDPTTTTQVATTAPTATSTIAATSVSEPAVPNLCSGVDFKNLTYDLPGYELVSVENGVGARGVPGDKYYVQAKVRQVVVGDIGGSNSDAETVVVTEVNVGGDELLTDAHVMSCTPTAVTILASAGGGDRAYGGIRAVSLKDGKLLVDRYADDNGACCPAAAVRTSYVLNGSKLVASDDKPVTRKITILDGPAPVALSFLANSSNAVVMGETGRAQPGGFTAFAGQTVSLAVEPGGPDQGGVTVDIVQAKKVLASATSGTATQLKLMADGYYELIARPTTPGTSARFDAEMSVHRIS